MSALELGVVIPTFNERDNVPLLLERLEAALQGIPFEVIFVDDDSPDGTAEVVRKFAVEDSRVRLVQRIGRRGLASACTEGMLATAAPCIAVMDADLQHDEKILPAMLARIRSERLDIVIATRNAPGGSMGDFSAGRVRLSQSGRFLSSLVSRHELSDPMSGFFMVTRAYLDEVAHSLSSIGYKILLDLIASSPRTVRIGEVPYRFGTREHGESKLDILVSLEYLQLLLAKLVGDYVPVRFILFGMVGSLGALLHLGVLYAGMHSLGGSFVQAQTLATLVIMIMNFLLNNLITYRDRRLRGIRLVGGLFSFCLACSVGAFVNVRVADFLAGGGWAWYAAGLIGIAIGSVWNYGVTAIFTWRNQRPRARRTA
jgi:dolichol-phosphate mannosyltransferase